MRAFESHPRLLIGVVCIALIVLWNIYNTLVGGNEPERGKPPPLTQHDKEFVIALHDLSQADLTDPDKVAAILKTRFAVTHTQGEEHDAECSGGKRPTEIDTYAPSSDFWTRWRNKTHEDVLLEAASGIKTEIPDPQFTYTVTRPRPCSGSFAGAPVAWGFARFTTAAAFSCLTESELQRAFPNLARDSWSTDTLKTYRAINSLSDDRGTMLVVADDSSTCLSAISVAGGHIWGRTYREAESRYLECEASVRTTYSQQDPEPAQDRSSLAAAHRDAPAHDAWAARLGAAIHQNCGGEPYFPDLLVP